MTHQPTTGIDPRTAPYAALLLRISLGAVFIAHALVKVFLLTLPGTAAFFAQHGFPPWTAYPVVVVELAGGAALAAGFHAREAALALVPVMLGALAVHWPNGWYFAVANGGWEYIGVLIAALVVQAGLGDGRFALGAVVRRSRRQLVSAPISVGASTPK